MKTKKKRTVKQRIILFYRRKGGFKWLFNIFAWLFVAIASIVVVGLLIAFQ